jgi:hypothetical protein
MLFLLSHSPRPEVNFVYFISLYQESRSEKSYDGIKSQVQYREVTGEETTFSSHELKLRITQAFCIRISLIT